MSIPPVKLGGGEDGTLKLGEATLDINTYKLRLLGATVNLRIVKFVFYIPEADYIYILGAARNL